jgi:hypothetical protein
VLLVLLAASGLVFIIALERRQPDPGRRWRESELAIRATLGATALRGAAGREPVAVRRRRDPSRIARPRMAVSRRATRRACPRPRADGRRQPALGRSPLALVAAVLLAFVPRPPTAEAGGLGSRGMSASSGTNRRLGLCRDPDRRVVRAAGGAGMLLARSLQAAARRSRRATC